MESRYSRGYNNVVFLTSVRQNGWFPRAQLSKETYDNDRLLFARQFYEHRIAHLLFPENFFEVVGAQVEPYRVGVPTDRVHRLFSRIAPISPDHAVYSEHMRIVVADGNAHKQSLCPCETCETHRNEHEKKSAYTEAKKLAQRLYPLGLILPYDDPSDYCLGDRGVIFFEIEEFDDQMLAAHLKGLPNPTMEERRALRLLRRYKTLFDQSRQEWKQGLSRNLRLGD